MIYSNVFKNAMITNTNEDGHCCTIKMCLGAGLWISWDPFQHCKRVTQSSEELNFDILHQLLMDMRGLIMLERKSSVH